MNRIPESVQNHVLLKSSDRQSGMLQRKTGALPLNIQMFAKRKSWIEKNNTSLSYNDVTTEWLKNTNPNSHKVLDAKYFVFKKNKYIVDGINVILDYSKKEKEVAEWLESIFG